MAVISRHTPWARQPQVSTPVDPQFAAGLISGFVGTEPFDFVQKAALLPDNGSVTRVARSAGVGINYPFLFCTGSPKQVTVSGSMSVLLLAEAQLPDPGLNAQAVFARAGTTNPRSPAIWFPDGTGNLSYQDDTTFYSIADELPFDTPFSFGVSVSGTSLTTAFQGDMRSYTIGNSPSFTEFLNYGARAGAGEWPFIGKIYLAAVWNRALAVDTLRELSIHPWRLFEPRARRVIVPASSGVPVLSAAAAIDVLATSARPRVTVTF